VLSLRQNPVAQQYVARLAHKHGKAKALTILAHKVARDVYFMLSRGHPFDSSKFFPAPASGGLRVATAEPTPRPTPGVAARGPRPSRVIDAARFGPPRPVPEGGGHLTTPEINPSTDEIPVAIHDAGVPMLSPID